MGAKSGRDFFSEMLSAKELVEDIRGERARREKGREREESEPEMYGCETRRLRLRDKRGGPSPPQAPAQKEEEFLTASEHGTHSGDAGL